MSAAGSADAAERTDPHCLDPRTAAALLRPGPWRRLAVVGDSVAAGVMGPRRGYRSESLAVRLTAALAATRTGFASTNLATPGLMVHEILAQQLGPATDFGPDLVLASAGGNDAFRRFDAREMEQGLRDLLEPFADRGATVVTVGLFDLARSGIVPAEHVERMARRFDELDQITASVTQSLGGVHVDTHHHPLSTDRDLYSEDGIHANARGHAVAFAAIVKALGAWMGEARSDPVGA